MWGRWDICHLEVADNAASGESFHLNSYIFHLLRYVSLAEKSWFIKRRFTTCYAKQHLSSISFKLPSIVFAKASNSGLSGSLRLGFHSLTFHIWIDWWSSSKYDKNSQSHSFTHHLELSIDFIFLEDWLLFLLLFDGRLNEIVTVVCDRPHLMKLMTLMLMTMKTKRKILTKKKKNYDISADHHCLSLFVLPHPGLLSRQTDETQVSKFQQQQLPQQQASATSGSNSNSIISNNAVVSSNIIIISTNLRPAVGIDRVEGEESTRLLDFALASTFSYCRCWHAGTIWKHEKKKMWPASSPEQMPPDQLFLLVCAFRKVVQRRGRRWLAASLNIIVRFHQICCTSWWSKQVGWLHAWVSSSDAQITLSYVHMIKKWS